MASKQAHVSIRDALASDDRLSEFKHKVLLQGSYKSNMNLAETVTSMWSFAWPTG